MTDCLKSIQIFFFENTKRSDFLSVIFDTNKDHSYFTVVPVCTFYNILTSDLSKQNVFLAALAFHRMPTLELLQTCHAADKEHSKQVLCLCRSSAAWLTRLFDWYAFSPTLHSIPTYSTYCKHLIVHILLF